MPTSAPSRATRFLTWQFPLPRPHTGVRLGNGVQGLMVWGDAALHLTVSRAGFWDRRGGNPFATVATFAKVRACLEANDAAGLRTLFNRAEGVPGQPGRPQQYGGGRLELTFPDGLRPTAARLRLRDAIIEIDLATAPGAPVAHTVRLHQARGREVAWLEGTAATDLFARTTVQAVPTWDYIGETLAPLGIAPPRRWNEADCGGWCQALPADPALAVAWERRAGTFFIATALGPHAEPEARALAGTADTIKLGRTARAWWKRYRADTPRVRLPDPVLQEVFDYGVMQQAGLTPPEGVAATLQGPWMEETRVPPWSNDYHFNINVELVYGPAFPTNRLEHLRPLWAMLRSWLPTMRQVGQAFFGRTGALMLPHAVDDRCQVVGTFWSGTIDHACTAWMALLAWEHHRYEPDPALARELAWPLLHGTFEGFAAMLEEIDDPSGHRRWSLPVSVSPEYGASDLRRCWGRDASFQLAALHAVLRVLPQAATVVGAPIDPRWADVARRLPLYTTTTTAADSADPSGSRRIALWAGQDLAESHRHHSHLAAIHPFGAVDPFDPAHHAVVAASLAHWAAMGAGRWTGWCTTWASMLCSRCGLLDAAVYWLHHYRRVFANEGHGPLHNAAFAGVSALDDGSLLQPDFARPPHFERREVMQMDAAMGAVSAVCALLVQDRGDRLHVVDRRPADWREVEFDGIRLPGAFLIGASVRHGRLTEVRVESLAGQPLRLEHGLGPRWTLDGAPRTEALLETSTAAGQRLVLRAAAP
jgi:alpha-L-fucosidase 2